VNHLGGLLANDVHSEDCTIIRINDELQQTVGSKDASPQALVESHGAFDDGVPLLLCLLLGDVVVTHFGYGPYANGKGLVVVSLQGDIFLSVLFAEHGRNGALGLLHARGRAHVNLVGRMSEMLE